MTTTSVYPTYLIIGSGRLAAHLHYYLSLNEDVYVRAWSRDASSRFNSILPQEIPNNEERLKKSLDDAEVVLLAIADNALQEWVNRPELKEKTVVHFSGARYFTNAWGFHPLMSFSSALYDPEFYAKIPFVADKGFPHLKVFPFLTNPVHEISPEQKPLYHALCHMAANFPALLWVHVFQHFENDLKLPHTVLKPILEKVLSNTLAQGEQALAGPLRRGDMKTIAAHDEALTTHPTLHSIYDKWTEWATKETFL